LEVAAMPNTIQSPCPRCQHQIGSIVVSSQSVMTLSCPECGHSWAVDLKAISPQLRDQLAAALGERDQPSLSN
jgi:transcription elongation factor Elf1